MRFASKSIAGWGHVLRSTQPVARPEKLADLRGVMSEDTEPLAPIGALRSYGDAALNSAGRGLMMTRLDRMLDFDPQLGVLEVEAGVTLSDIVDTIGPQGWIPAAVPGSGFVSVGGAIANDVHGKNHHVTGSFGSSVESLELMGADGRSRKITPSRDKGLFQATIGGVGQTGIILSARLKLVPCPSMAVRVDERRMSDLDAFMDAFEASSAHFSVGWIDATATGIKIGRGILEEAEFAPPDVTVTPKQRRVPIPMAAPGFALSRPVVRLFNMLYLRRMPEDGRVRDRALASFLFPLDQLTDWYRLYGAKGFHQFQCVLPDAGAREHLHAMLSEIAEAGVASPLTVLKQLGPSRAGYMSFPIEGWTLAVDLRNRRGVRELIDRLESRVREAGGRVYLAKDAVSTPAAMRDMYPDLTTFAEKIAKADPDGRFETDLCRRLGLRAT